MRTTWQPLRNETKRGDSVELSRFFVYRKICELNNDQSEKK